MMKCQASSPAMRPRFAAALVWLACAGCGPGGSQPAAVDGGETSPVVFVNPTDAHAGASEKPVYKLAGSIYAGWMPWYYADEAGVLDKWAEREGIEIDLVSMDYIASIEAFVTGQADACLVTNIDAVGLPAVAGIDTTVLIIGDYSNGNDKILARGIDRVAGLRGAEVLLVELSVSDYLLSRALQEVGLSQRDVRLTNTGDAAIEKEFLSDQRRRAVVTWNPIASRLARAPGVRSIYDSSQIPGEILDLCVVNTETLRRDPRLGRALVGAWFEVLSLMQEPDSRRQGALAKMAELAGCTTAEYESQLKSTYMFWTAGEALAFAESPELQESMEPVRQFCFDKKLLGDAAADVDAVGIAYPDGTVQGRPGSIRLRFDTQFLKPSP